MKRVIAVVATLALASTQAIALTGTDLYQLCIESKKGSEADGSLYARRHEDNALCAFYVRGFIDGFDDGTWAHSWGVKICVPDEGISVDQGRLILEKRLREHPEFLHFEAGTIFGVAMADAFRCPSK
jgi:hypothetical protein